jgi:hypothetical protein
MFDFTTIASAVGTPRPCAAAQSGLRMSAQNGSGALPTYVATGYVHKALNASIMPTTRYRAEWPEPAAIVASAVTQGSSALPSSRRKSMHRVSRPCCVRVSVDVEVDWLAKFAGTLEQRKPRGVAAIELANCSVRLRPPYAGHNLPQRSAAALADMIAPSSRCADFGYLAEEVRVHAGHVAQNQAAATALQPR